MEDFLCYTGDMAYDGVPSDANIIDNIGPLTGSRKVLIIYDPNNEYKFSHRLTASSRTDKLGVL